MKLVLVGLLLGCAPASKRPPADHPASPTAPTGRLAGPPAALRAGVADTPAPAPAPAGHEHDTQTPTPKTP